MKTYFSNLIPKIISYSKKLDNSSVLTNQHWKVIDENQDEKTTYIFRNQNNDLLISRNGKVEKAKWDLIDQNTLLIDTKTESRLFKHGFADDCVLALKVDGKTEYAFLVNENKVPDSVKSVEGVVAFLEEKYLVNGNSKNILDGAVSTQVDKVEKNELLDSGKSRREQESGSIGIIVLVVLAFVYFAYIVMAYAS